MPSWVKTDKDEELWDKAKKIVKKEYELSEDDGESFWKLVTGVYKRSGGTITKETSKPINNILDSLNEAKLIKSKYGIRWASDFRVELVKALSTLYIDRAFESSLSPKKSSNTGVYYFAYYNVPKSYAGDYSKDFRTSAGVIVSFRVTGFNSSGGLKRDVSPVAVYANNFTLELNEFSRLPYGVPKLTKVTSNSIDAIYTAIVSYMTKYHKQLYPLESLSTKVGKVKF